MNAMVKITSDVPVPQTSALGHVALHFRPGEGAQAVRFFELLGAGIKTFGPFNNGDHFYIVALNSAAQDVAENIVFLSAMTPQQFDLEQEIASHLGVGTAQPHAKLQAFFSEKAREPEFFLHLGVHFARLEDLEAAVQRLQRAIDGDPAFAARFQGFQLLRARGAADDVEIPTRMAASPVFSTTERYAYGQHIAQVHIRTDLFAAGLSFLGAVVELDYIFVGAKRPRNAFNDLILD
jgi:hypothetical protein